MTKNPRDELVELMASNRDLLGENLYSLFGRTVEDLVSAGLDRTSIANAALYVGCCEQQKILGTEALIEALRGIADDYERRHNDPENVAMRRPQ